MNRLRQMVWAGVPKFEGHVGRSTHVVGRSEATSARSCCAPAREDQKRDRSSREKNVIAWCSVTSGPPSGRWWWPIIPLRLRENVAVREKRPRRTTLQPAPGMASPGWTRAKESGMDFGAVTSPPHGPCCWQIGTTPSWTHDVVVAPEYARYVDGSPRVRAYAPGPFAVWRSSG